MSITSSDFFRIRWGLPIRTQPAWTSAAQNKMRWQSTEPLMHDKTPTTASESISSNSNARNVLYHPCLQSPVHLKYSLGWISEESHAWWFQPSDISVGMDHDPISGEVKKKTSSLGKMGKKHQKKNHWKNLSNIFVKLSPIFLNCWPLRHL